VTLSSALKSRERDQAHQHVLETAVDNDLLPILETGAVTRQEQHYDCGDLVAGEPPQTQFATAFEQLVDGKVRLEDEVAVVFDLDGARLRCVGCASAAVTGRLDLTAHACRRLRCQGCGKGKRSAIP
jgi:hypothetical protein